MLKCRFGDLVKEVKEKVDRNNNPYEYFIAGEHMDTDELHLLRRGTFVGNDVGPAFVRVFKPGQILFGSRRTYLRKIAVADFEGVTANTTFVLESKDETILHQRLLPFIMQSERFIQHTIHRSKGSTNPYVLFSDLADFEFCLPDIDHQKKIADLLWSVDNLKMAYKNLLVSTNELVKSQFIEMFGRLPDNDHDWETGIISDILEDIQYGTSSPAVENGQYPYIRMNNVSYDGRLDLSDIKYINASDEEVTKYRVKRGDVIFNRTNSKDLVGKTCVYNRDEIMILAGYNIRLRVNGRMRAEFLSAFLNTDFSKQKLRSICKESINQSNISATELKKMKIYIPPFSLQHAYIKIKEHLDKSKFNLHFVQRGLRAMQKLEILES